MASGEGSSRALPESSPTVMLIRDSPTFHTAKTHLWPLFVQHLSILRVAITLSALSHFTEVPLLFPEPSDVEVQKRTQHCQ